MRVTVIIPAGGNSTRFNSSDHQASDVLGALRSKLDEDLGGKTVLQRTVELFNTRDDVQQIIVAGPSDPQAFTSFKEQHGDRLSLLGVKLIQGGQIDRWQTVQLAIDQVDPTCTHIAVHDAARPATPIELIDRIFDAAKFHSAVVPGVAISDTIKRVNPEPVDYGAHADPIAAILGDADITPSYFVHETIDRSNAMSVQTPQIFERDLLVKAYEQDDLASTDDAGLVERLGRKVLVVAGDPTNIKLTRTKDLPLLRAIMGVKNPSTRPTHKRF